MGDQRANRRTVKPKIDTDAEKRELRELLQRVRRGSDGNLPPVEKDREAQLKLGRLISEIKLKKRYD